MKRIPIYRFKNDAGLYMKGRILSFAIGEEEYNSYLSKFFEKDITGLKRGKAHIIHYSKEDLNLLIESMNREIELLKNAYKHIAGSSFHIDESTLSIYDNQRKGKEGKTEAFSIAESLYRIIEFYMRFIFYSSLSMEGGIEYERRTPA